MNNSQQNSNDCTTIFKIPKYQIIERIYQGSRTLVYRAIRTDDQLPVIIKLLKNDYPSFSELVQFRNQYTIAKNLNSLLIIQTYSLEIYQNSYALVMEDFGGDFSSRMGCQRQESTVFERIFSYSDRSLQCLRYTLPRTDYSQRYQTQ